MKSNHNSGKKKVLSVCLALVLLIGTFPAATVFATQASGYTDPADNWLQTGNRTNELDMNASVTQETQYCTNCEKSTLTLTYRVPEYTKTGETALNRGVRYSDGTCIDGVSKGNLDDGTPGVDASFTGYHWSKSVCQTCGTINSIEGPDWYNYNKNVYCLNSCDHSFFVDFDNTSHEPYSATQHVTTLKKGQYCQFCKGTYAKASERRESHHFEKMVDGQIGNNRFYVTEKCEDCGYETTEYVTAKSVVSSYYGNVDGDAHTLTVSDLSDSEVHTSIRYGTSAGKCNLTSAPNYTDAGYYPVYYEIDYQYGRENMTENGVSYVWLLEKDGDTIIIVPPVNTEEKHTHDYRYVETIAPSCESLGYERWQCDGCGRLEKRNYIPATGHKHKAITVREATCKQGGLKLFMCEKCGDFYEESTSVANHKYRDVRHNATCRTTGCTEHICEVCGDNYITDITPLVSHAFERITKQPTCMDKGYTTSTCTMCGLNYVSDYTEPTGHNWDEGHTVTNSTCDAEGVTEFHCLNCTEKMIKATDATGHTTGKAATCTEPQVCEKCGTVLELPKGHTYSETVIAPTCTAMGYSVFECSECGDSYTGNFTDKAEHDYNTVVTAPTCTEHGYTTYSCKNCDDEYISDYTEKLAHNYAEAVTNPTCTAMGYSTFTCADCGDEYQADYKEPLGHTPSEWIVDTAATIEHAGSKHIECTVCKTITQTVELPQLIDKDNSDEDGNAKIGDYSIILTDENGKPVFNSELTIDVNDNVSIKMTAGRLLDYAKPTTITAFYTETQQPKENLHISIVDANGNKATGETNADGQLVVPNNQSSTGDDNGTIGKDDGEVKETFVVTVTDKTNTVIPNCGIYIGESNNLVVDLPDGIKPTREYPVIITVTDQNGSAQTGITVIALGDADYVEKGVTDIYGKITLPTASDGYTDENGKVNVDELNVIVKDELGAIPNAYVQHNEDDSITVTIPEDKTINYDNRITVTVLDSVGTAVKDKSVTVKDAAETAYTALTDENGKIIVPPVHTDVTDSEGNAAVNGYHVVIADESKPIENAYIEMVDGKIYVKLPEGVNIDIENRITATITDSENLPVKGMSVTFADSNDKTETNLTDESGKATVPPTNIDYTDVNGYAQVIEGDNSYNIVVEDTKTKIENAYIEISDGKISVTLPDEHTLTTDNQTTVTVTDKDGKPVSGISVTIKDKTAEKTAATNASGKVTLPVKTSGGGGGSSRPSGGGSGGGGGYISTNTVNVKITDKDGKAVTGFSKSTDSKGVVTITLPNGKTIDGGNYYTIVLTDRNGKAKADTAIILKDKKNNAANGTTDKNGMLTLPANEHKAYVVGYTDGTFQPDGDMTRAEAAAIFARLISEEKGEKISGTKNNFTDVKSNEWHAGYISYLEKYGIIKGYSDNTFRPDEAVTRAEFVSMTVRYYGLFDKVSYPANTTKYSDINGKHWAIKDISFAKNIGWLNGYADGTFRPDNNITRAEVVTVVNHATGRYADKEYINKNLSVLNKFTDLRNNSHWGYYEIMEAANTHKAVSNSDTETWVK